MKQLTAVEWFVYKLNLEPDAWIKDLIEQAKEMDKQNTIDFATKYDEYCHKSFVNNRHLSIKSAKEFYNETFKSE